MWIPLLRYQFLLNKPYPRDYLALDPEVLISGYNSAYFSLRKAVLD